LAALELVHDAERDVAEPGVLAGRHHRDGHAARLETGRGGARAVDGIHDEERARPAEGDQSAVLRVEADVTRSRQGVLDDPFGDLVDRQCGVTTRSFGDAVAGLGRAHHGCDCVAHPGRDLQGQAVGLGHRATARRAIARS
jgi:hypothetical protein